ncbi:MAG TPA: hypothetical protein VFA20_06140 [Myxococcaceae bacterium]|nr:hypothetical protein [Myxococcaceae bacterium]
MIFDVVEDGPDRLRVATSRRARRGRGVLFATAPLIVYLAFAGVCLVLAARDMTLWSQVKEAWIAGAKAAAFLAVACFFLGFRVRDELAATAGSIHLVHSPALGTARILQLRTAELTSLAVDASLRSLGADVLLVAVRRDGVRVPLLEGDPHSDQVRSLARRIAALASLPVEAPKFTSGGAPA